MEINLFLLKLLYSWTMYSFLHVIRGDRWGEFAWVGAIIFKESFMVSDQFSWEGGVFLVCNCQGAIVRGGGGGGGEQLSGGQFSSEAIILESDFPPGHINLYFHCCYYYSFC